MRTQQFEVELHVGGQNDFDDVLAQLLELVLLEHAQNVAVVLAQVVPVRQQLALVSRLVANDFEQNGRVVPLQRTFIVVPNRQFRPRGTMKRVVAPVVVQIVSEATQNERELQRVIQNVFEALERLEQVEPGVRDGDSVMEVVVGAPLARVVVLRLAREVVEGLQVDAKLRQKRLE